MRKFPELQFVVRKCVICLVFLTICQIWTVADNTNPVCDSTHCRMLGNYFLKNLNERENPCNNFYNYVCGKWGKQNPRPKHEETWNTDKLLEYRVAVKLKNLLEDKALTNVTDGEKAKALYKGCMNFPFMLRDTPNTIKETMKKIGNWPMFLPEKKELPQDIHWSQIDNQYIAIAGESAFFDHYLVANTINNELKLLLKQPSSAFGMLNIHDKPLGSKEKTHYKTFLTEVIKSVAPSNPVPFMNIINRDLSDVIKFRYELNAISKATSKASNLELLTIGKYQEMYNKKTKSKDKAKINWLAKIRAIYKDSKNVLGITISDTEQIIFQTEYFSLLADLLGKTARRVLVNHIHVYFAERHVRLNAKMEDELQKSIAFNGFPYDTIRYAPERWQRCINIHNMITTLGQMYVKQYFPIKDEEKVHELFYDAKDLLKQQVSESTWLSLSAKSIAISKVDSITSQIGFPAWYTGGFVNAMTDTNDINPLKVDTYFARRKHKFYISAATLQWPLFTPNVPYVINYGSTVPILGHELYHAFGTEAIKYYKEIEQNWLTRDMYAEYKRRIKCFEDQYNKYNQKESLKDSVIPPFGIPDTYDEDMPDAMGLKLAYKGYKQKLQQNKGICPVLPGFEKFGCEKLFFIAFANEMCSNSSRNSERALLWFDKHSLPWIRLNGAVANMPEFSQAFGCKPKDPLTPTKTCDLWN